MKRIIVSICMLLTFTVNPIFPLRIGPLPDVSKPESICIFSNELFVTEGATISIYSLKGLNLVTKFGKKGEGPGEVTVTPNYINRIIAFQDYIFIDSMNKITYFSKKGELIKERKKPFFPIQVIPIGENFVVRRLIVGEDEKTTYITINIFDSNMEPIKEIGRQKWAQQESDPPIKLDMISDLLNFCVYENKVFVEKSTKGLFIEVFDCKGEKLYQIEKPFEKIKVTDSEKNAVIEEFKEDPMIKFQMKEAGGWDNYKKFIVMIFPDTFPAIQNIEVSNNTIYVQTYKVKDNKEQYIVMDLKGNILKKIFMPKFKNVPLMSKLLGSKLYSISDNKLYYLKENVSEVWELHAEEIK